MTPGWIRRHQWPAGKDRRCKQCGQLKGNAQRFCKWRETRKPLVTSQRRVVKPKSPPLLDSEIQSFGVGPLNLDVSLARLHGWSEKQIARVADAIGKLARKEGSIAERRHPELAKENGVSV